MDYTFLVFFFFSIEEHARRCSSIRKKSNPRNTEKKRDEGGSPKRSRSGKETCRYRDVTSDRPFFPGYSINISLWTLQRPRPARTKYLKSSSLELPLKYLPSPASLRADRVEAIGGVYGAATSHHCFENGVARGWRRQVFFAFRAFFSQKIGEGEPTVQSGKSDKPRERDFFSPDLSPRRYATRNEVPGGKCVNFLRQKRE